jgi:hypothetical protein
MVVSFEVDRPGHPQMMQMESDASALICVSSGSSADASSKYDLPLKQPCGLVWQSGMETVILPKAACITPAVSLSANL